MVKQELMGKDYEELGVDFKEELREFLNKYRVNLGRIRKRYNVTDIKHTTPG